MPGQLSAISRRYEVIRKTQVLFHILILFRIGLVGAEVAIDGTGELAAKKIPHHRAQLAQSFESVEQYPGV